MSDHFGTLSIQRWMPHISPALAGWHQSADYLQGPSMTFIEVFFTNQIPQLKIKQTKVSFSVISVALLQRSTLF